MWQDISGVISKLVGIALYSGQISARSPGLDLPQQLTCHCGVGILRLETSELTLGFCKHSNLSVEDGGGDLGACFRYLIELFTETGG